MDLLTTRYFGPYRPGQAPLGVGRGQLISAFTPPPCSCCVPPRVHRAGEAAQYGVELKAASAQEIAAREAQRQAYEHDQCAPGQRAEHTQEGLVCWGAPPPLAARAEEIPWVPLGIAVAVGFLWRGGSMDLLTTRYRVSRVASLFSVPVTQMREIGS